MSVVSKSMSHSVHKDGTSKPVSYRAQLQNSIRQLRSAPLLGHDGLRKRSINTVTVSLGAGGSTGAKLRASLVYPASKYVFKHFELLAGKSQQTLRSIYLNTLPGPLCWAPSFLVPLAAWVSVFGATSGHILLHNLNRLQAPESIPVARVLQDLYTKNSGICDTAFDSLLATPGMLLIFVALPALDMILGIDPKTPEEARGSEGVYKGVLYLHVLIHWALLAWACASLAGAHVHPITFLGLIGTMACYGACMFTVTHELLHSPKRLDKTMASMGLMPLAYMHWVPSHIAHHCKVGTPDDPTTARLGEPLYRYIPRSVWGNIKDGVASEACRLAARRLPLMSPHNRMFQWAAGPLSLLAGVYSLWGAKAAAFGIGQAALAICMLEAVNYIEHYALQRKKLADGSYERLSIFHSWNANWLFTNSVVFSVQRHSDHHAHAYKPYQLLEDVGEAPQLPASYPVMMLLALFPGLFFDVMDPRAMQVAHRRGQTLHK